MRPWMVNLLSLVAAALAAAGPALPFLSFAPHFAISPAILPHTPDVAAAALAGYALAALVLTTAILIGDLGRLRRRLVALTALPSPSGRDLVGAFAISRLRYFAAGRAPAELPSAAAAGTIPTYGPLKSDEARSEIARLRHIWLARTHFFTALALLAAIAALGLTQQYRTITVLPGAIPTVWVLLALGGLVLLAGLSRLAIDVAGEPVVIAIRRLPCEPLEAALLRRLTESFSTGRGAAPPGFEDLAKRLSAGIRESRRVQLEAAAELAAAAEALGATIRSAIEALDAAVRATSERAVQLGQDAAGVPAIAELQVGVDRLTAALDRLGMAAQATEEAEAGAIGRPPGGDRRLANELAQLLREIDAET